MNRRKWDHESYSGAYDNLTAAEVAIHQAKEQMRLSWQHGPADYLTYCKLAGQLSQADERIREVVMWGSNSCTL